MKRIITFVFLVIFMQGCSSFEVVTTKSIPVEKIIYIKGEAQNSLFVKANNWMVNNFKNAKSVVQFTDKESGNVSGRYLLSMVMPASDYAPASYAYATINIKVKDGAAKIIITPESFVYVKNNMFTYYTEEQSQKDVNSLIDSFSTSIKIAEDNNW